MQSILNNCCAVEESESDFTCATSSVIDFIGIFFSPDCRLCTFCVLGMRTVERGGTKLGLPLDIDKRQALCASLQALNVVDSAPDKGQVGDTLGTKYNITQSQKLFDRKDKGPYQVRQMNRKKVIRRSRDKEVAACGENTSRPPKSKN